MIKEFVPFWEKRKGELEEYLTLAEQGCYDSYEALVKLIFQFIINPECSVFSQYVLSDIHVIDDGDYQGTQLFLIHKDRYQPGVRDYVLASVDYGSCSGCDTLLAISGYETGVPDEGQVRDYMTLCLHLFQSMQFLKDEAET